MEITVTNGPVVACTYATDEIEIWVDLVNTHISRQIFAKLSNVCLIYLEYLIFETKENMYLDS